jgi:RNA polymerase sigma-70 factor (ECF subfamily)
MSLDKADQEFARLVDDNRRALHRYVLRRLADVESSDDVVVDTFVVAWRKRSELPPRDRELPWLFSIAFRVISNHRRARDRQNRLYWRLALEREVTPNDDETPRAESELLLKAMHELAEIDQELLQLVYWEKLKYRDVAVVLGISENAVAIRATRAKKSLRKLLNDPSTSPPTIDVDGEEVGA